MVIKSAIDRFSTKKKEQILLPCLLPFSIRVNLIHVLYAVADMSKMVDRAPFNITPGMHFLAVFRGDCNAKTVLACPGARKAWRIVRSCKPGMPDSCMQPVGDKLQRRHFLHDHIMSVLMGGEYDVTPYFSNTPSLSTRQSFTKRTANQMLATTAEQQCI